MKEQKINPQESMDIITAMIDQTKIRLHIGDGNILLMWGYLTVSVSALVGTLLYVTENPVWNWLWFLIMVIGGVATPVMAREKRIRTGAQTYTDRLSSGTGMIIGYGCLAGFVVCLAFMLVGDRNVWSMMLVLALLLTGMNEVVQGMIIKERSLMFGGAVGMMAGIVTLACIIGDVPLYISWFIPVFIAAWVCMMIVPGHCLNAKARRSR